MATHAAAVVAAGNGAGARRGPPPSRANIELNKQIMRCTAGQLCELISSRVHSFNHVNVATAFRKLLPGEYTQVRCMCEYTQVAPIQERDN